jgi:DNA-binding LacI/PurR family transcriptional regulator
MPGASADLNHFLDALAADAKPGDRVPPVRHLMSRFGVSQLVVEQALDRLKARRPIESQIGRGTFFSAHEPSFAAAAAAAPAVRSVLLLRRSASIVRGRVVVDGLQQRFAAEGHRVLEVSYTDSDHARAVLKGLPRFDACVVQSSFEAIAIETLAMVRQKADVVAVDGMSLVGAEVDAVGLEWGEPLARAIHLLAQRGHRRLAFAATSRPFLPLELARRRLDELRRSLPDLDLQSLALPQLPQEDLDGALVAMLKQRINASGCLPFTALVAWGIDDGAGFQKRLSAIGLAVPSSLSVVLLGRADLANEHAGFFEVVGCNAADQIDYLYEAIGARWADPARAYGVRFLPVVTRAGASVGAPPRTTSPPMPAATQPTRRRAQA